MHQAEIQTANPLLANTNLKSRAMHLLRTAWAIWDVSVNAARFSTSTSTVSEISARLWEEALKEAHKLFWK